MSSESSSEQETPANNLLSRPPYHRSRGRNNYNEVEAETSDSSDSSSSSESVSEPEPIEEVDSEGEPISMTVPRQPDTEEKKPKPVQHKPAPPLVEKPKPIRPEYMEKAFLERDVEAT